MGFLERMLRAMTPFGQRDWLAQHSGAEQVKRTHEAGGFKVVYCDPRTNEWAIYHTDPAGNVLSVYVRP